MATTSVRREILVATIREAHLASLARFDFDPAEAIADAVEALDREAVPA